MLSLYHLNLFDLNVLSQKSANAMQSFISPGEILECVDLKRTGPAFVSIL